MADVVKKSSEVVTSGASSSKKISSRQESHEIREVVKQSSVTSSSMVKQQQQQSTSMQQSTQQSTSSSSSTTSSSSSATSGSGTVVVSSTSSIQLKQKQISSEMSNQVAGGGGGAQITSSSSTKQQQIIMSQVNGQPPQQQVSSSSQSQKSIQQVQQQQQIQNNTGGVQQGNAVGNYIEEENENEEDLKVRKKKKKVKKTESFSVKSSFSKFEGAGAVATNRSSNQEDQQERANGNNKNAGTRTCKGCGEKVFVMEMIKAEKSSYHKNCFRCSECKKALNVDTYESNGGLLYCKPHFKELFQPKAVFESPEEAIAKRLKKRTELIIRENQPEELPPDVVRATTQPATADLEDLSVDVKSKFELFEHFKETDIKEREPIIVKRSTSVLAKLAKYQGSMDGQVGIPDSELNGGAPEVVSEDEDDDEMPKGRPQEEFNYKLDDVKSKWESGMNSKKEEIHMHRQAEMQKFRTRLCLGKNSQLKEMYEKAVESSDQEVKKATDLDELDLKGKRNIKEMFEKGLVTRGADEEEDGEENNRASAIDLDREVFEHGVAKTSRNLFQTLDKQVSVNSGPVSPLPGGGPKKMESPEREVYRDPNVVRSTTDTEQVVTGRTASKMLSVFKRLEETAGTDETDQKTIRRPLKQFTPPRETRVERKDSSAEEEEESEYESEEEEPYENGNGTNVNNEEDQFLKEVGSLARAKNLRAKFEKWEIEENSRNERENGKISYNQQEGDLIGEASSIESTKSIRARFEQPQQFEQPKVPKREVQVKRFVELQNSNGLNMEECVICNKRVYVMEKTEAMGKIYHKNCFRCSQCKCVLRMGNFTQNQGTLYCTPHFKQLFKIKGNYDEGFGYETGKQIWMKKQQAKQAAESGGESKEN